MKHDDLNLSFADVITKEVLARKHQALVVPGAGHVTKGDTQREAGNATSRVESHHPGSTFIVLLDNPGVCLLQTPKARSTRSIQASRLSTCLQELPWARHSTDGARVSPMMRMHCFISATPSGFTMAFPAPGSLESAYLTEIDRRSMIEWGELRARKFLGPAAH